MPVGAESIRAGFGRGAHVVTSGNIPLWYAVSRSAAQLVKRRPPRRLLGHPWVQRRHGEQKPTTVQHRSLRSGRSCDDRLGSSPALVVLLDRCHSGGRKQDVFAVWGVGCAFASFSNSGTAYGVANDRRRRGEMSADTPWPLKVEGFLCASPLGGPERTRPGLTTDPVSPRNRRR